MTRWYTSDTHFNHSNILVHSWSTRKLAIRKQLSANDYNSVEFPKHLKSELSNLISYHDDYLIQKWNQFIAPNDEVYHMGDFSFYNAEQTASLLDCLNGRKYLIKGNHDKVITRTLLEKFVWVKDYYRLKTSVNNQKVDIIMSHFPFLVWDKSHYDSWHVHGHCHGTLKKDSQTRLDVGIDAHGLMPISDDDLFDYMINKSFIPIDHHKPKE